MEIKRLKEYIYENKKVEEILSEMNCHSIKYHSSGYWTCGNPDGDNRQAVTIYNNEHLNCINYTRDIGTPSDLLSLVCFYKKNSFFESIKWICQLVGLDYYHDFNEEIPESLKITKLIYEMQQGEYDNQEEKQLKPIPEKILDYYMPYVNDMFANDGISYGTQREFEIGYDDFTNRITIPIRDELGKLIGVKGRLLKNELEDHELKYIYLESCARSKILYGLYKTYPFIKNQGKCFIGEAEKFPLQLWSMGYCNSVGIGGTKVTNQQIEKLTRLGVDLIFCFDKGIEKKEIEKIADRFVEGINIYYLWDDKNILKDKESPSDNKIKFEYLYENCLYKIK